jgi:hypothetical protein
VTIVSPLRVHLNPRDDESEQVCRRSVAGLVLTHLAPEQGRQVPGHGPEVPQRVGPYSVLSGHVTRSGQKLIGH